MAETSQHAHSPVLRALRSSLDRVRTELRLLTHRLTALAFVGGSALLGADSFGLLMWLWPLYPTMVPLVLIGCAIAYGLATAALGPRRSPAALTDRGLRRGLPRRLR